MLFGTIIILVTCQLISGQFCSRNERWSRCPGCEVKCGESPDKPCSFGCKPPSCYCDPARGLRRGSDGQCVREATCSTKMCEENEKWTHCSGCELNCGDDGNKPCSAHCNPPSCFCDPTKGFRRNSDGKCILKSSCSSHKCRRNEVWTECTGCELDCHEDLDKPCSSVCKPPSCFCDPSKGFRRKRDGRCILEDSCPAKSCERHEKWTTCTGCELKCGDDENKPCAAGCKPPSCFCDPSTGNRRGDDGRCIRAVLCPTKFCGLNEEWTACTGCELTCDDAKDKACASVCKPPSCFCDPSKGFRRRDDGRCIRDLLCPTKFCSLNEKWTSCTGCELKCGEDKHKPCSAGCKPPSCFCDPAKGYRRDSDKRCIRETFCPAEPVEHCELNEKWTTCTGCELKCGEDRHKPCASGCKPPSCFCDPSNGLRRKSDGRCVREIFCPAEPVEHCELNEKWTTCTGCELKCGEDRHKPCAIGCKPPSCFCDPSKGLRRGSDGRCVREIFCPAEPVEHCELNEKWTTCTGCELKCGEDRHKPCASGCKPPSCFCDPSKDLRRGSDGRCVRESSCQTNLCSLNEKWTTCTGCELKCGEAEKPCPRMCKPPSCFCDPAEGFRRGNDMQCVRESVCPVKRCKENEKWTTCSGCELSCGDDENKPCSAGCKPPSCFCDPSLGLRRNDRDQCVQVSSCSNICLDNEIWTECTRCELNCSDPKHKVCSAVCKPPSCFCDPEHGFRRQNDGRCIPLSSCLN